MAQWSPLVRSASISSLYLDVSVCITGRYKNPKSVNTSTSNLYSFPISTSPMIAKTMSQCYPGFVSLVLKSNHSLASQWHGYTSYPFYWSHRSSLRKTLGRHHTHGSIRNGLNLHKVRRSSDGCRAHWCIVRSQYQLSIVVIPCVGWMLLIHEVLLVGWHLLNHEWHQLSGVGGMEAVIANLVAQRQDLDNVDSL